MLVTIIIPTYNRSNFIESTLLSIVNQTFPHWEAIVVDDGSTDDTYEVVEKMCVEESRIKILRRNRGPKGAPTCRNIGLENAKGEFVMFLDSDDLLGYYCLDQRVSYISRYNNREFWVFPMLLFTKHISDTKLYTNLPNEEDDLNRFLRSDLPWSISCVLWRKSFLKQLNGFDESFPNCQDHDLHLRALWKTKNYQTFPQAVPDNFYRQHDGEKIYNPDNKERVLIGARMLMYRHAAVVCSQTNSINRMIYAHNLSIYFKYLVKQHLFISDYENAIRLKEYLVRSGILAPQWALLFQMYISLAKFGLSRIKGFHRLWDTVFFKFRNKTNWGKIYFKGDLCFSHRQVQTETKFSL